MFSKSTKKPKRVKSPCVSHWTPSPSLPHRKILRLLACPKSKNITGYPKKDPGKISFYCNLAAKKSSFYKKSPMRKKNLMPLAIPGFHLCSILSFGYFTRLGLLCGLLIATGFLICHNETLRFEYIFTKSGFLACFLTLSFFI
jgi:hypothetical protein